MRRHKPVYYRQGGTFVRAPVYDRAMLWVAHALDRPALVEEHASTTVIAPGERLGVDQFGNLDIAVGAVA